MTSLRDALVSWGLLARTTLSGEVDALLSSLDGGVVPDGPDVRGTAQLVVDNQALGFLSLTLAPPTPGIPYHLVHDQAAGTFRLWLVLSQAAPARSLFRFATGLVGTVLTPAARHADGDQEWLEPVAGDVSLAGVGVAVLVDGRPGAEASLTLVPGDGQVGGLLRLTLEPSTVLLGDTGFGLELPDGVVVDTSTTDAAPGETVIDGHHVALDADVPAWQGMLARSARFYVPRGVGIVGGHAVDAYVAVGTDPAGIEMAISTRWHPPGGGPAVEVLIECREPGARGLQDFVPTLVEAAVTLPVGDPPPEVSGQALTVAAGKPVVARLRFARSAADPTTRMSFSFEAQGPEGILSVHAPEGGVPARGVIAAGALATALVADKPPADADASGSGLHALLVVALGLSALLKDHGRLTINGVELESEGHGIPVGGAVRLRIDYSVDVLINPIGIGTLSVEIRDEQPMRVRNRNVLLTYDPSRDGLDRFRLDFSKADMEIEDPGSWKVNGPGSLFDILGTRSGRGSMWLEVDLRFKLNLGPVKVSGATIRATMADDGSLSASLRGLDAMLDVPGVLHGEGRFQLLSPDGFAAELDVAVVPLDLAAGATVVYQPHGDSYLLLLRLGVDLPGPLPVANSGLGIYGLAGSFGVNAKPVPPAAADHVASVLAWDSAAPDAWDFAGGELTVGVELVIGTLPDLGFSFSTKGGVFLTIPDLAVRGVLWGTVLTPRMSVNDRPTEADVGLAFRGVVVVDPADGVTVGLQGTLKVPVLVDAVVPLGAHFPTVGDTSQWFLNLGADGYANPLRDDGRGSGPIRATVLPGLMPTSADLYLMQQGHGIDKWPRNQAGAISVDDGFVIAFGFGFSYTLGVKPIAWAEVHARLDVLLATRPLMLAGFGSVGGSLNLGPFSIGVDADLKFLVAPDKYSLYARLCGHIDLFFTEIEGCVEISLNDEPAKAVPRPDVHPLDELVNGQVVGSQAYLVDDRYRRIAAMAASPEVAEEEARRVWPDTLLHLAFGRSPALGAGFAGGQFTGIDSYPWGLAAQPVGGDMLRYDWTLTKVALSDVTGDPQGPGTPVAGPLSAAWQVGKDGDPGVRPQAGDLVLLTYRDDLWLDRVGDPSATRPGDPLGHGSGLCQDEPELGPTWAVGWGATGWGGLLQLPADPQYADPCRQPFTATVDLAWVDSQAGIVQTLELPAPYGYRNPSFTAGNPSPRLDERDFDGILELGGVRGHARLISANSAVITPSEPVDDARLWLVHGREPVGDEQEFLVVNDDRGQTWNSTSQPLDDGRTATRFTPPAPGPVRSISVFWGLGARVGLLGLGGVGEAATGARAVRRSARSAAALVQAQAAATQPQAPGTSTGAGARCLLDPGRLYRVDVDLTWSGYLYERAEDGTKTEAAKALDQAKYDPPGAPDSSTRRTFWFRTVDPPHDNLTVVQGEKNYLSVLHRSQGSFEPEMLERHLAGYTPSQSETARFCDDPLQAHFRVSHVASLAAKLGYDVAVAVRRVDVAGNDGLATFPVVAWVAMAATHLLTPADQARTAVALASKCPAPRPGASAQVLTPLAPEAWYEVYVDLQAKPGSGAPPGRLPGVTFRTSRWRRPAEMLMALGFAPVPGQATGDLPVHDPGSVTAGDPGAGDGSFQQAMTLLGLDGWPVANAPRTSLLWVSADAGRWALAGLLVESPEPVDRPGRCSVHQVRTADGAITFGTRRSDRTRSRLLFLTDAPSVPAGPSSLVMELSDEPAASMLIASLAVPAQPAFVEEP